MSRKVIGTVVFVGIAAMVASPAPAADWTLQASSGFSLPLYTNGGWGMNLTRDYKRIMFNSIAIDGNGYVFATANALNDNTQPGGVTVYQPNGSGGYTKLRDIDVNASAWPGMITKLMTRRQDGQVYALQNYSEIETGYTFNVPNRILKLQADGTVSLVKDLTAYFQGLGYTAAQSWVEDAEMGPDGHIYFNVNGADGYFKYHHFWRINMPGGAVQEAVRDTAVNEGHAARQLMFSLKYVGTKNYVDSFTDLHLGGSPARTANPWAWGWDRINPDPVGSNYYLRPVNPNGDNSPNWGRDRTTLLAYDGTRKALWMGVRGPAETYNRWQAYRQTTSEAEPAAGQGWGDLTLDPADTTGVVNMGAVTWNKENDRIRWFQPAEYLNDPKFINGLTIAARLKLVNWNSPAYFIAISPSGYANCQGNDTNPWVGVRVNGSNLELCDIKNNNAVLKNIGTFANNTWMEIRLFGTAYQNQDRVKCWVNGVLQYDSAGPDPDPQLTPANWMYTGVGTGVGGYISSAPNLPRTGTGKIVIDWLGYHLGEYTGDAATWANELPDADTPVGSFQPCHVLPHYWLYSAIMTRWVGTDSEPSLYSGVGISGQNPDPMPGVTRVDAWHCNGNDPAASNKSTGAPYWVQAMAINPCDGSAYMSWSAFLVNTAHGDSSRFAWGYYLDDSVSPYASLGKVYRVGFYDPGLYGPEADQGAMPGAGANSVVAALAFTPSGSTVLAHVIDSTDRTYKLYAAPNPNGGYCCNDPFADVVPAGGDGFVDMNDFAAWQRCYNDNPVDFQPECACFDRNGDQRVNGQDLISFINCASSPGVQADPNCDGF